MFIRRAGTPSSIAAQVNRDLQPAPSAPTPLATVPAYKVLYTFTGGADGGNPLGGNLILDPEGNLYGTASTDLACTELQPPGCGVVFRVDKTGKENVLYTFTGGADGGGPIAGVVRDEAGNLYGTTFEGGSDRSGVVFKLDRTGKETVLYSFTGGEDGNGPSAGLMRDVAGNLYGTTFGGGSNGSGVVFRVDRTSKESVLYSFTGGVDGGSPSTDLVEDKEHNLYGTTGGGGDLSCALGNGFGCGVVFKLDRTGKETVIHSFTGGADGAFPFAGLVRDEAGNLYGTAAGGGFVGAGVVFKLDRTGQETVLYSFTGGADGGSPIADLVRDDEGNLYSTTSAGGDLGCFGGGSQCGVVFKLDRRGKETVLYTFTGGTDGGYNFDGLVRDEMGNIFGATGYGGDQCAVLLGTAAEWYSKLSLNANGMTARRRTKS